MIRLAPRATRTNTLVPYTTRFRSPTLDLLFIERFGGEGRHRNRHILDRFHLLLRRADDFVPIIIGTCGRGSLACVSHCLHPEDIAIAMIGEKIGRATWWERVCQYV